MKLFYTLISILFFSLITNAQEFSFKLYLEDASGVKDSLVFGYDEQATDAIDSFFEEVNIISTLYPEAFESRISDYDILTINFPTFHTNKQIQKKDCVSGSFPLISVIELSAVTFPLKVSWDSLLFTDICRQKSLITDWNPGAWFDGVSGMEQGPFYLNAHDTVIFTHTTHQYVNGNGDTIDLLFFTLASDNNFISGLDETEDSYSINLFPNPTKGILNIKSESINLQIENIQLFDLSGKEYPIKWTGDIVDLKGKSEGLYFIRLTLKSGDFIMKKIVIE